MFHHPNLENRSIKGESILRPKRYCNYILFDRPSAELISTGHLQDHVPILFRNGHDRKTAELYQVEFIKATVLFYLG